MENDQKKGSIVRFRPRSDGNWNSKDGKVVRMPRYFFHIHDADGIVPDEEGSQCDSMEAVRTEALLSARELLANDAKSGRLRVDRRFEITDESNRVVLTVPFADAVRPDREAPPNRAA